MKKTTMMRLLLALAVVAISVASASVSAASKTANSVASANKVAAVAADRALQRAYAREIAFVQAEAASLRKRLAALKGEQKSRSGRAEAAIAGLSRTILKARREADAMDAKIRELERDGEAIDENKDLFGESVQRAVDTLNEAGVELAVPGKRLAKVAAITQAAATLLGQASAVRRERGTYFDSDGRQRKGDLLRVGSIASYVHHDGTTAALAPAGGGHLKVWPQSAANAAPLFDASTGPDEAERGGMLPIFVYGSLDKAINPPKEQTAFELVDKGGIVAWVIVGLGAVAAVLALLRAILLLVAARGGRATDRVVDLVGRGELADARAAATRAGGAVGATVRAVVGRLGEARAIIEDVASESMLAQSGRIERFGATISVCAAVAPLLGLLGTVAGMIATFDVITEHGTGDPKMLSGGISEALITTELGLVVAIPALLLGTLLSGYARRIETRMEEAALRVINAYERTVPTDGDAPPDVRTTVNNAGVNATNVAAAALLP